MMRLTRHIPLKYLFLLFALVGRCKKLRRKWSAEDILKREG